eukprot:gene1048-1419_t
MGGHGILPIDARRFGRLRDDFDPAQRGELCNDRLQALSVKLIEAITEAPEIEATTDRRIERVLQAIRENEFRAEAIGYRVVVYRTTSSVLSALFATMAGAMLALWLRYNGPDTSLSFEIMMDCLLIVVIGGIGTVEGPIIGVIVFFLLQNLLADYGSWYLLLLGTIAIVTMLFAPRGLWGLFSARTGIQLFPERMADITTDVLIIGTGPAGSATAALLSTYGIENLAINRYRWLANTPRAHITNQRAMEVIRDLGREVEDEVYLYAAPQHMMGENIFCESLAGEEIGRMKAWGNHPLSKAEHLMSSPTKMNDMPQTFMEPLLFKTACQRGTQARMSTEYVSHMQDADGVTTTCRDRLTKKEFTIRSKYLIGADGGKSLVAEHAGLPFEGKMAVG